MTTAELKKNLKSKIASNDDTVFLELMYSLMESRASSKSNEMWESLNKDEQEQIDQSINQVAEPNKVYNAIDIIGKR